MTTFGLETLDSPQTRGRLVGDFKSIMKKVKELDVSTQTSSKSVLFCIPFGKLARRQHLSKQDRPSGLWWECGSSFCLHSLCLGAG